MLTVGRIALAHQRALDHARIRRETGSIALAPTITARQALSRMMIEGARALGLADRVGHLAPGMQADLVMIDARALNLWPMNDPVATVLQASLAKIEAVMIAGRWRKRGGRLLHAGLDNPREALAASSRCILAAAGRQAP